MIIHFSRCDHPWNTVSVLPIFRFISKDSVSYFAVNCAMHIMTTSTVLSPIASSRDRQIIRPKVNGWVCSRFTTCSTQDFPQLKWQTRGLNWFVFDSVASPALKDFTYYAFFIAVPLFCAFIILPFMHMLIIVMKWAQRRFFSCKKTLFQCSQKY